MTKYLSINLEVSEALKNKTPIVALESTIISHGMPYPQNVQTDSKHNKSSENMVQHLQPLQLLMGF